ncbi:hypothetical protein [Candidatus Entotheonella palauensis]|uniref:hypothetical protein n=1 Tax=Candidatus Entotheonella palauensis TaxID=93172 RepID=UPI000B7EB8E3|nr:hypothetical protein [Candidatus Entotheonella palauensis]
MPVCELCRREVGEVTKHHLILRTRHKNKKNKKDFARDDVKSRLADLCRPCHKQIHTVLTNKELERHYNSLEALRSHPDIRQFCVWIAKRPADTFVRSRRPAHRRLGRKV